MKQTDLILIIFLILTSLTIFSQTGTIEGQVFDRRENKGLAFAVVRLVDTKIFTKTDFEGGFKLDSIPIGAYDLKISYIGYGDTTVKSIKISADTILKVKLELPPPCQYDKHRDNKICPICKKKNKVVPIIYGLTIGELDKKNFYYAGCEITFCDPKWYCKRDKHKF